MWRAVYEVGVGNDRCGHPYGGAVQTDNEDLRMRAEGMAEVEIEGDKGLEILFAYVWLLPRG